MRHEKTGKRKGECIVITLSCFDTSINFVNKIVEYLCVSEWGIIHSLTWKVCVSAVLCWCRRFDTDAFFALDTSGVSGTYKSKKLILFLFKYSPYQRIFLMKVSVFNKFSFIVMYWFYLWQDAIRSCYGSVWGSCKGSAAIEHIYQDWAVL